MSKNPLVSVILCVYNQERYIARALRSALAQRAARVEVVVVDDGSTDGTASAAAPFLSDPRVKFARLKRNRGPAAARNRGLALSRGALIAFLDADDVWRPGKLARQLREFRDPRVRFCHGEIDIVDAAGRVVRRRYMRRARSEWGADIRFRAGGRLRSIAGFPHFFVPPCTSTVLLRRSLLKSAGRFDENFRHVYDDTDLWWRVGLRLRPAESRFVPEALVEKRRHRESLMASLARAAKSPAARRHGALRLDQFRFLHKHRILPPGLSA